MDQVNREAKKTKKAYTAPKLTIYGDLRGIVKNFTTNVSNEAIGAGKCNPGKDTNKPCYLG